MAPPLSELQLTDFPGEVDRIQKETRVELSTVIEGTDNVILVAPREHGLTTLGNHFTFEILAASKVGPAPRLAISISAHNFKPYRDLLQREIRREIALQSDGIVDADALIESRSLVVVIDDVDLDITSLMKPYNALISQMPNVRFIFLAYTMMARDMFPILDSTVPGFRVISVKPFGISDIRRYLRNDPIVRHEAIESLAEQYFILFQRMGISSTSVYLSMFVSGSRSEGSILNIAVLAQNFIEKLFKKYNVGDDTSADYEGRIDLFSFVAACMKDDREVCPFYERFIQYCRRYYDHVRMKPDNMMLIIDQTIRDGILLRKNDKLSFRFQSIFSYFVARKMLVDKRFYRRVLDNPSDNLLDVALYCGLNRNDAEVLDQVRIHVDKAFDDFAEACGQPLDPHFADAYRPPTVRIVDRLIYSQLEILSNPDDTAKLRVDMEDMEKYPEDLITDRSGDIIEGGDKIEVGDKNVKQLANVMRSITDRAVDIMADNEIKIEKFEVCMRMLQLYRTCLKYLQQIPGDEKVLHLNILLIRWSESTSHMLIGLQAFLNEVEKNGLAIIIDETETKVKLKPNLRQLLERLLSLMPPSFAATYIKHDVGTEKLGRVLLEAKPDDYSSAKVSPHFQARPKASEKAAFWRRSSSYRSMSGRSLASGMLGMRS